MTEAAAALIERTERMLRQAALDRTLVRLAALNRLLGETRLGAAPPRRTVSGGSSDAAACVARRGSVWCATRDRGRD